MTENTQEPSVQFTESAIFKLKDLLAEENNPNLKFRVFIQGGGCSGFQYGFVFDEIKNDDDFVVLADEHLTILVDSMSMQYLQDAEIDYVEELMGSSFKVKNPNATTTCGCGSSFS